MHRKNEYDLHIIIVTVIIIMNPIKLFYIHNYYTLKICFTVQTIISEQLTNKTTGMLFKQMSFSYSCFI